MGCGASGKVSQVKDIHGNVSGSVRVFLESAILYEEDMWYSGKIEAFAVLHFGKKTVQSHPSNLEGNRPYWGEVITFQKTVEDEMILIEIWNDHGLLNDILIGSTAVSLMDIKYGGSQKFSLDLKDERNNKKGQLYLELSFACAFVSNPISQQLDSPGFVSFKARTVNLDIYPDAPGVIMKYLLIVSLNEKQKCITSISPESANPTWTEILIFHREISEDILKCSIYDCSGQSVFECIGSGYLSLCRVLAKTNDMRKVVLWNQGKFVGSIQIQLAYNPSLICTQYCNPEQIWNVSDDMDTESAMKFKRQRYESFLKNQTQKVALMKKACNRPELKLEEQIKTSRYLNFGEDLKAIEKCKKDLAFEETPLEGSATFTYKDGSVYVGEFKDHLRHGKGKLVGLNQQFIYEGEWKNDRFHGQGKLTSEQSFYQGEFAKGLKNGPGRHTCLHNQVIEITYVQDEMDGMMKVISEEGENKNNILFECEFQKGTPKRIKNPTWNKVEPSEEWFTYQEELTFSQLRKYQNEFTNNNQKINDEDSENISSNNQNNLNGNLPLTQLNQLINPSAIAYTKAFQGRRLNNGRLFSQDFKFCIALTSRGTLKKIMLPSLNETWNNSYSDPHNRPYFFWLNPISSHFQIIGANGILFEFPSSFKQGVLTLKNNGRLVLTDPITNENTQISI